MPGNITWPTTAPFQAETGYMRVAPLSAINRSPFTGSVKSLGLQSLWVAKYKWNNKSLDDAAALQTLIDEIGGPSRVVEMFDWHNTVTNSALSAASPLVKTAAAAGATSITLKSLPLSTACMVRGNVFEVEGYLYKTMTDVTSDGSGEATISILPPLRTGVAADDAVTVSYPRCPMRMLETAEAVIDRSWHGMPFELNFVEDVA